jgi:uncharacterized protein
LPAKTTPPAPTAAQRAAAQAQPNDIPVMRQRWAGLLFLHWPILPELIQARLPAGLFVDTYDGQAWIGVVPFFMEAVRPVFLPPLPKLSWFLELNVRTYVYDAQGRPGVWFFSLDCNQALAVDIARKFFHLPYQHAKMQSQRSGDRVKYSSTRKSSTDKLCYYDYELPKHGETAVAGSLEFFLVERYLLFSSSPNGKLFCGKVHHSPYQIATTACDAWSPEPLIFNGFSDIRYEPISILTALTVDVTIYPLRAISSV